MIVSEFIGLLKSLNPDATVRVMATYIAGYSTAVKYVDFEPLFHCCYYVHDGQAMIDLGEEQLSHAGGLPRR
jgi:hypothetical protein